MTDEYKVHGHVDLSTDANVDRYRSATIMCKGPGDKVSLWINSVGLGFSVDFTQDQAKAIAALLTAAVTP